MYCLVQGDDFAALSAASATTDAHIPLVSFGDMDRDGMVDMVFFRDSAVHTFYNMYSANSASETNLCKQGYDSKHLVQNRLFALFSDLGKDTFVSERYTPT